ncbi:MAG: OmpA family protein [Bacteroidia bacterium]|nr:OmpA family protein [Bacteroidia bacterium]
MIIFLIACFPTILKSQIESDSQQHVLNVYFNKNSDKLNAEAFSIIRKNLIEIGTQNIQKIKLKGFADSDHTDSFNLDLSSRRTKSVYEYLLTQAVPTELIEMESLGESVSISEQKSLNRRVELIIFYRLFNIKVYKKNTQLVITGKVINKHTSNPLASTIVIEYNKLTMFASSGSNGKFIIKSGSGSLLTFNRDGFLNSSIIITDSLIKKSINDTLYLDIKMTPIEVTEKIVFEKIYFYSDSDSLKPESKTDLQRLLNILSKDNTLLIEIQGHMNCPLSYPLNHVQKKYNHELSYKRAKAVYKYLIKNGISASRLSYKGMSNFKMIYPQPKNEKEADKNKRVEVWKLKVIEH